MGSASSVTPMFGRVLSSGFATSATTARIRAGWNRLSKRCSSSSFPGASSVGVRASVTPTTVRSALCRKRTEMAVQRLWIWAAARQTCSMKWKSMGLRRGEKANRRGRSTRASQFCGISHIVAVFFQSCSDLTFNSGSFRVYRMVT